MRKNLSVAVICNDERNEAWIKLLRHHVPQLYKLQAGRYYMVTPDDSDGLSIPLRRLPEKVDAILFHSSDMKILDNVTLDATYVFKFNTTGTPQTNNNVIPIYRPTFPHFGIEPLDVDELVAFISGELEELPSMCQQKVAIDLLPALFVLSQQYLAALELLPDLVKRPSWWTDSLGLLRKNESDFGDFQKLKERLNLEWPSTKNKDAPRQAVEQLLSNLSIKESTANVAPSDTISIDVVEAAYHELQAAMGSSSKPNSLLADGNIDEELPTAVLAVRESYSAVATASVLAMELNINRHLLEPENLGAWQENLRTAILLLSESQVACLPTLRLQGFAGPVLVLSPDKDFSVLKQKYRVLRFGQGSHCALTSPFALDDLFTTARNMVPLGQENLAYFQKEMKAVHTLYQEEILPCLNQVEETGDISKVEAIIAKVRTETPVACHTVVEVKGEKLQIQEHLRQGIEILKVQEKPLFYLDYLREVFEHWFDLVKSAAGENLKLASN
jgi:hypothetical protein